MTKSNRCPVLFSAALFGLAVPAFAQVIEDMPAPTGREWQQEQNLSWNKEKPAAWFSSFASPESALSILPDKAENWTNLDGDWKFNWAKDPDSRPKDFFKADFNSDSWKAIKVPSSWQTQGYGVAIYSNQPYPFERNWPSVMDTPKDKRYTSLEQRNPVGSYIREFEWKGGDDREAYIQFDGVDSFFYLWINGKYVGFSKDSRNPARFNISRFVKPGKNSIAVEVYRHSDGAYLECQDMFRLSGIFRSVWLVNLPKVHVRDFFVNVNPLSNLGGSRLPVDPVNPGDVNGDWRMLVDIDVANTFSRSTPAEGYSVAMQLYDADGKPVAPVEAKDKPYDGIVEQPLRLSGLKNFKTSLLAIYSKPKLWSAEIPNLYTLVVSLKDKEGKVVEAVSTHVGFRNVVITKDKKFLVNGQPVKLKGVNRHESFPTLGHTVPREEMEKEVAMMKKANINHVRNSHYPTDYYFYYLCDKHGIYLQDEANIESHGYYYGKESLSHPTEWMDAHVDRVMSMVERNKNHPSVIMWSLGNEAGPGRNFQVAEKSIKARDLSRPSHYERNNDITDMGSNQYPSVGWVQNTAESKSDVKYPFYISEYAHNMMNAMGNLADYWEHIESSDKIMGGAIWDWVDQGLEQLDKNGKRRLAYGGDFGDAPNSGQFVFNGVILADRTPEPGYFEVRHVYQHIKATLKDGKLDIFNKYFFKDLSDYTCNWQLLNNGAVVASGELNLPEVAPRKTVSIPLDFLPKVKEGGEQYLRVEFRLKADKPWAKAGTLIALDGVMLSNSANAPAKLYSAKGELKVSDNGADISGKDFSLKFDPKTGELVNYVFGGSSLLDKPFQMNAFRCPSSNEVGTSNSWFSNGLRQLKHTLQSQKVTAHEGYVTIDQKIKVTGLQSERCVDYGGNNTKIEKVDGELSDNNTHFIVHAIWTVYADGSIGLQSSILPRGANIELARVGYEVTLPGSLDEIKWYGLGPEETYPDRKSGSLLGLYTSSVKDSFFPYGRPQDTGTHEDTRWVALFNKKTGKGFSIATVANPFAFSALPYSATDLVNAMHPVDLPEKTDKTVLVLAAATRGLGGASCGPGPMERDIIKANKPYTMSFILRPFDLAQDGNGVTPVSLPKAELDMTMVKATQAYTIKSVSSQEQGSGSAENAVDGDPGTIWHSEYGKTVTKYPHTLEVDMGKEKTVKALTYLPRQDGNANGRVAKYSWAVSSDGKKWTPVAEGTFENNASLKTSTLKQPVKARYFQFNALSEQGGSDYASAAEVGAVTQ